MLRPLTVLKSTSLIELHFFDNNLSSATALPLPAAASAAATSAAIVFTVVDGVTGGSGKAGFILTPVDGTGFTAGQAAIPATAGKTGLLHRTVLIAISDQ